MNESPQETQPVKSRLGIRLIPETNPPRWEFAWIEADPARPEASPPSQPQGSALPLAKPSVPDRGSRSSCPFARFRKRLESARNRPRV
jgi:hypothetical protein